jgi:mannose-1-phosphate guanylyltransferase
MSNSVPVVAVFPSDHFIWEEDRFMDYVDIAVQKVTRHPSEIVLLGVEAEYVEPEYGYIIPQRDAPFDLRGTRRIARFIEKPSASIAHGLIESGGLWNTMIMVFKVKTLLHLVSASTRRFTRSSVRFLKPSVRRLPPKLATTFIETLSR